MRTGWRSAVLIETSWNVKKPEVPGTPEEPERINRNIVECKVQLFPEMPASALVLIETSWNVKLIPSKFSTASEAY